MLLLCQINLLTADAGDKKKSFINMCFSHCYQATKQHAVLLSTGAKSCWLAVTCWRVLPL